jgi:hypothetical protein
MSTLANWRIVLFWTKIGVACIGISAPSFFPRPLLSMVMVWGAGVDDDDVDCSFTCGGDWDLFDCWIS